MALVYAEDVNYWKTSVKSPDSWLEDTKSLIQSIGGKILSDMIATMDGKTAIMIQFQIADDRYKIVYPILTIRKEADRAAAKRQAATAMYHEVKALIVSAKFRSIRGAFHSYLVLPDGRTAGDLSAHEIAEAIPTPFLLTAPK
jgi:hypothetical protein